MIARLVVLMMLVGIASFALAPTASAEPLGGCGGILDAACTDSGCEGSSCWDTPCTVYVDVEFVTGDLNESPYEVCTHI